MSEAKVRVRVAHNAMHLPVVALRGLVVFPNNVVHFEVGRQKSIAAIEAAMHANSNIFLIAQKDMETEEPTAQDLYAYGVISEIKQVLRVSEDLVKVLVEGKSRAKLLDLDASGKYLQADVRPAPVRGVAPDKRTQTEALVRSLKECFEEYLSYSPQISKDVVYNIVSSDNPLYLSEYMPANLLLKYEDKQTILQENSIPSRLEKLLLVMRQECEVLAIEKELDDKVNVQMDKNQRDYYLREQMHIISEELGDAEDTRAEAEKYAQKIQDLHLDAASEEKLLKECERLGKMAGNQAEISVIRSYLDTVIGLPWHTFTKDDLNQAHARKVLDHDHYGLEKVKERILEILAVRQLNTDVKGQIICLVGPPGVGKTSIARSVAACMGRNFARMSLGGVHDEAEIRGHRRTYVGALPGKIIQSLKRVKSSNPLFCLDEIDKMTSDFRGDPASALLEVLDPEQNNTFMDHYLDLEYDLSKVFFITTANSLDTIPAPLLDRMEIIELNSYLETEKRQIARNFLLPRQVKEHGLKPENIALSDGAILEIIRSYTREAGVRNLEREIAALCRKTAIRLVEDNDLDKCVSISRQNLASFLGVKKYRHEERESESQVGVCAGLAYNQRGGEILMVETSLMSGSGQVVITGQLGDVMTESARAALTYVRSRAEILGLDPRFHRKVDIHVHVPDGATPKDGPSAGITLATSITSALLGIPVRNDVAMTGEISLRGRVLPIGGLREKLLAARRSGIKKVLMPHDNEKDLKEVPAEVLEDLEIVFVDHVDEVLPHALAASVEEIFSGRATAQPLYLSLRAGKNDKDSSAAAPQ